MIRSLSCSSSRRREATTIQLQEPHLTVPLGPQVQCITSGEMVHWYDALMNGQVLNQIHSTN